MQWLNTCILVGILLMVLFLLQMKMKVCFGGFLRCLCYRAEKEYLWVVSFLVFCLNVNSFFLKWKELLKQLPQRSQSVLS